MALLRLCATHFGEMAPENPERDQVKNSIAAAIEGMPAPATAVDKDHADEPEAASSDYLYLKMREGGWLVEESDRWLIRVTMPEGYRRLMTVLRDLKENVAKSFTGLVSQVSSLIGAAADDPTMHATNIDAAWQTAVGFRRHMAGIDAALLSVTRRLNSAEGMDESVDVFFAEFVDRILIRDWTKILSQNNPWRSAITSPARSAKSSALRRPSNRRWLRTSRRVMRRRRARPRR
ncbi:Wadjet anti-phage system protein JetA family protein [Bradyrhizobium elkanii]|uniref:Wadjet anti-phage system protein JetA family protein n=1 Tax=Bradyrhizobium elkanii TaxID=29448 RepID=UPI002FF0C03D